MIISEFHIRGAFIFHTFTLLIVLKQPENCCTVEMQKLMSALKKQERLSERSKVIYLVWKFKLKTASLSFEKFFSLFFHRFQSLVSTNENKTERRTKIGTLKLCKRRNAGWVLIDTKLFTVVKCHCSDWDRKCKLSCGTEVHSYSGGIFYLVLVVISWIVVEDDDKWSM